MERALFLNISTIFILGTEAMCRFSSLVGQKRGGDRERIFR